MLAIPKPLLLTTLRQLRRNKVFVRAYGTPVIRDVLKLRQRGIFQNLMPERCAPDFTKHLSSPQCVYCGFDPTAKSLHIGNLLAIIALIHFQRAGHLPIALVGGATAQIGDPSGRSKDRDAMPEEEIRENVRGLMENLERIFTNHAIHIWNDDRELKDVKLINNLSWYKDENVIQFLTTFGRHFRLTYMLGKKSVKSRLATPEGMSFTEFTYQIFQSYDWIKLLQKYNCLIQIGGNDQYGNIASGLDTIDRVAKKRAFGLTMPIVTTAGGEKIGKSANNALWLDPKKTTPFEFYQYFLNVGDGDVEQYLRWFTFLPDEDIDKLARDHKFAPEKRKAQTLLAEKVVLLVHGETGLLEAQRWTEAFFSKSAETLLHLSDTDMQALFSTAPTSDILLQHDLTVMQLCMKIGAFQNEKDADDIITHGGLQINKRKVTEPEHVLTLGEHILPNNISLLRIGKKRYHIVRWVTPS